MNDKEEMRDRELLTLAKDQQYQQLLKELSYNWEICASRMDQITKERQVGLYDDTGVEVMAVFNRLERVGTLMLAIKNHPQAHLLKDFRNQLSRAGAVIESLANRYNFKGHLQCDGFAGYETAFKTNPDVWLINCMVHV